MDGWKSDKLAEINKEVANVETYNADLQGKKEEIDSLLRKSDVIKRDQKIKAIFDGIFKNNAKYTKYQSIGSLKAHIDQITMKTTAEFGTFTTHGALKTDVESKMFVVPTIVVDIENREQKEEGFKVRIKWEFWPDNDEKTADFTIKYKENEEKKNNETNDWNIFDDLIINKDDENQYSAEPATLFAFNQEYTFCVEKMIMKPAKMMIMSDINFQVTGSVVTLDISQINEINLQIHSYGGFWMDNDKYHPRNVLRASPDVRYCSKAITHDDWIIFQNVGVFKYPVYVKILGSNKSNCLKDFILFAGFAGKNEWVKLNETVLSAQRTDDDEQTFELDIVKNNSKKNFLNDRWKQIEEKKYKHFKLLIKNNYGSMNNIMLNRFVLYGVKMQ